MLGDSWTGILWAMERQLRGSNETVSRKIRELRADIRRDCGGINARLTNALVGPLMLWTAKRERFGSARALPTSPR